MIDIDLAKQLAEVALKDSELATKLKEIENMPDVVGKYSEIEDMPESISLDDSQLKGAGEPYETEEKAENTYDGLTDEEKQRVREAHPDWPDEIIDSIASLKEYELLEKANLKLAYINDKPCLIRTDIDMNKADEFGRTNAERMASGIAPIGNDGKSLNLHHIGQRKDSPLAELTATEHRENYSVHHDSSRESEVHGEDSTWDKERQAHWKKRQELEGK